MSKPFVFNAFKKLLFEAGSDETKDLYNSIYFDAWICPKGKNFAGGNGLTARLSTYFKDSNAGINKCIDYIGNLGILLIISRFQFSQNKWGIIEIQTL